MLVKGPNGEKCKILYNANMQNWIQEYHKLNKSKRMEMGTVKLTMPTPENKKSNNQIIQRHDQHRNYELPISAVK